MSIVQTSQLLKSLALLPILTFFACSDAASGKPSQYNKHSLIEEVFNGSGTSTTEGEAMFKAYCSRRRCLPREDYVRVDKKKDVIPMVRFRAINPTKLDQGFETWFSCYRTDSKLFCTSFDEPLLVR